MKDAWPIRRRAAINMASTSNYTFGVGALPARRLERLADAFGESSRAFLSSVSSSASSWAGARSPAHAVDLGCGPGRTTRLVDEVLNPAHVTGLDASDAFLALARASSPAHLDFRQHDVRCAPFPCARPDFLYARFLVTHLAEPRAVLAAWYEAAADGSTLAIEETADMRSPDPTFCAYYAMVAELQAGYGQAMDIGRRLDAIAGQTRWRVARTSIDAIVLDAAVMAELHAMNIATWKNDPRARAVFAPADVERVERELGEVVRGERSAPPVTTEMRRLVLRR